MFMMEAMTIVALLRFAGFEESLQISYWSLLLVSSLVTYLGGRFRPPRAA